jgi:hypothetical protein
VEKAHSFPASIAFFDGKRKSQLSKNQPQKVFFPG